MIVMMILAIADRPSRERISAIVADHRVDMVCMLGDLSASCLSDLRRVLDVPKLGVYGNHDAGSYFESLGIVNMHLRTFKHGGLVFGGFEGCVRYKGGSFYRMYTQDEASVLLRDFPYVDVMLTHCPPYGVNDVPGEAAHEGFLALRRYVETMRPRFLLHGHTYPNADGVVRRVGDSEIVYVYGDTLVDVA
jgi:Icc-related predicted phosphoesterase